MRQMHAFIGPSEAPQHITLTNDEDAANGFKTRQLFTVTESKSKLKNEFLQKFRHARFGQIRCVRKMGRETDRDFSLSSQNVWSSRLETKPLTQSNDNRNG